MVNSTFKHLCGDVNVAPIFPHHHRDGSITGKGNIIGKNPADGDLHVSKDDKTGNAVDAITASTITSRAFLKAINQAYAVYIKSNKKR